MAAAGTPAMQTPSRARHSTSRWKSGMKAEAQANRAAPSSPRRISRSRPKRSAMRLKGMSSRAMARVPAATLKLALAGEMPNSWVSWGSTGWVP